CGDAGLTSGSSLGGICAIDNYQYNASNVTSAQMSQCFSPIVTGSASSTNCTSGTACYATAQHCLPTCTSTCSTGYTCTLVQDITNVGGNCSPANRCPGDYTCNGVTGKCELQICIPNNNSNSCFSTALSASCASADYCDTTVVPICAGGLAKCPSSDYQA